MDLSVGEATAPLGDEWAQMTYPMYRHLLALAGTDAADEHGFRSIAARVLVGDRPIALAQAQVHTSDPATAELVSIYVVEDFRNAGVATMVLEALEQALMRHGVQRVEGTYMTGKPVIAAVERVLQKRGFDAPRRRSIAVKFAPEEPARAVWYQKARMPQGATIFPWSQLTAEERQWLQDSQAERQWIHPELEPWRFDEGFEPVSSVGMRKDGEVVGWAINHLIASKLVRFTVAYMRRDLAARGASFPLYVASLKRLQGTGVMCTFITASNFESMNKFVLRRVCPVVTWCGETRGVSKTLSTAAAAAGSAT